MTDEYALRLAEKWAKGQPCTLKPDQMIEDYHKACAVALKERINRETSCEGCECCQKNCFDSVGIDNYGVYLSSGSSRPPEYEKFRFCPMCGRKLKGARDERD